MDKNVVNWTTAQVANWLHEAGLGQYVELFKTNDVDGDVLLTMSEKDVTDPPLSFPTFGDIRRFGIALGELKSGLKNIGSVSIGEKQPVLKKTSAKESNVNFEDFYLAIGLTLYGYVNYSRPVCSTVVIHVVLFTYCYICIFFHCLLTAPCNKLPMYICRSCYKKA